MQIAITQDLLHVEATGSHDETDGFSIALGALVEGGQRHPDLGVRLMANRLLELFCTMCESDEDEGSTCTARIAYPEAIYQALVINCFSDMFTPALVGTGCLSVLRLHLYSLLNAVCERAPIDDADRLRNALTGACWPIVNLYQQWVDILVDDWAATPEDDRPSMLYAVVHALTHADEIERYQRLRRHINEHIERTGCVRSQVELEDLDGWKLPGAVYGTQVFGLLQ